MDELEIGGKKYISSRRAAKENKYHIDYIGQLIRAGKVLGKKVGRSWYVEEVSLRDYLKGEVRQPIVQTAPVVEPVPQPSPAVSVEATIPVQVFAPAPAAPIIEEKETPAYVRPAVVEKIYEEKIPARVTEVPRAKNLMYVEDDEPMLPVLEGRSRSNADFVPVPMRRVTPEAEEVTITVEEPAQYRAKNNTSLGLVARSRSIVFAALLILTLTAVASSVLVTSITVSEGQPASVAITIK